MPTIDLRPITTPLHGFGKTGEASSNIKISLSFSTRKRLKDTRKYWTSKSKSMEGLTLSGCSRRGCSQRKRRRETKNQQLMKEMLPKRRQIALSKRFRASLFGANYQSSFKVKINQLSRDNQQNSTEELPHCILWRQFFWMVSPFLPHQVLYQLQVVLKTWAEVQWDEFALGSFGLFYAIRP